MQSIGKLPGFAKLGLFLVLLIISAIFFFLNPEEEGVFPECIFHSVTGYYCPGCGSQRAFHNLLHLNFTGVVSNNLLFLPGMLVLIYGIALPFINRRFNTNYKNILYNKWTPLWIFIIIILFAVLRNLPYYPFSVLAPN
ncbi:MAG: DUF2752 domain-containing protein [Prolixibacteraceae bacterium]|nr:DUF2752 domain-containing protein [Prolixibacteraceae bacterium]MBN2774830.1 DUF2752 domain-containing protein [Prolixibacteraceae bacterium]